MNRRAAIFIAFLFWLGANSVYAVDENQQRYDNQGSPEKKTESSGAVIELSREDFEQILLPAIHTFCGKCHRKYFDDYEKVLSLVSVKNPAKSKLYQKVKGEGGHPEVWPGGSSELKVLEKWILGEPLGEALK